MKTFFAKENDVEKKWYLVDADDKVLGRMAVQIARVLLGKHKPTFTPHADAGDYVIVTNSIKVRLTGKKAENKRYYRYSGYPGGLHSVSFAEKLKHKPDDIIREAVYGMMPKNKLTRQMMKKLKIYAGSEHPHTAQQPVPLEV
ncbi:MAG TPA: 50S ribosomal protein L13 [Planctomycetota bacterium]|nr:50S ribosomal protein L13 [Planctomycetota bacterium]